MAVYCDSAGQSAGRTGTTDRTSTTSSSSSRKGREGKRGGCRRLAGRCCKLGAQARNRGSPLSGGAHPAWPGCAGSAPAAPARTRCRQPWRQRARSPRNAQRGEKQVRPPGPGRHAYRLLLIRPRIQVSLRSADGRACTRLTTLSHEPAREESRHGHCVHPCRLYIARVYSAIALVDSRRRPRTLFAPAGAA